MKYVRVLKNQIIGFSIISDEFSLLCKIPGANINRANAYKADIFKDDVRLESAYIHYCYNGSLMNTNLINFIDKPLFVSHYFKTRLRERNVTVNRVCNFKLPEKKTIQIELRIDCSLDIGNGQFWFNNWNINILSPEYLSKISMISLYGVTIDVRLRRDYIY